MSVHFDIANGKFLYTWQVISDDGSKYFTSDGQLVTKSNLVPSAGTPLAFLEYTTASVSEYQIAVHYVPWAPVLPNYDVDWGDGSTETGVTAAQKNHTYSTAGVYTIKITPAEGSVFRPHLQSGSNYQTNLTKINGSGGSQFGTDLTGAFRSATALTTIGQIDTSSVINFTTAFEGLSNLTSFPQLNTSSGTNFFYTWSNCTGLTSFPLIDTSSATNLQNAWNGCTSLTSFPQIDTSSATNLIAAWSFCSGLTSFPLIDTSSVTSFNSAWKGCTSLTSFPQIDTSSATSFNSTWRVCSGLTAFPSLDYSIATNIGYAWFNCSSLTTFPANQFDTTGTLISAAFQNAWRNCALTAQSIENILTSLDTNGSSNITLVINGGTNAAKSTWSTAANTAYNNLITKGWTITYNS